MEDWIFLDEFHEAGRVIRLGKRIGDGALYTFEPFATRLRGSEAGRIQKEISARAGSYPGSPDGAVLPVTGPFCFQGRNWLGWPARNGSPVFKEAAPSGAFPQNPCVHPRQLMSIIRSYKQFHECGLVVGRPDWGRCYWNDEGFFMVDPRALAYLAPVNSRLPAGFQGCRPPESFRGMPSSREEDCFYLGLILYYLLTGSQPYPLIDGWPTRALLAGEWIPPQTYRMGLDPRLSRVIVAMLDPEPYRRPELEQVAEIWQAVSSSPEPSPVPGSQAGIPDGQGRNRLRKYHWLEIWRQSWKKVLAVGVGGFILLGLFWPVIHPSENSPLSVTEKFYRDAGTVAAGSAAGNNGMLADFSAVKTERLKLAEDLLSRPVAEVIRLTPLDRNSSRLVIQAELRWWNWSGRVWNSRVSRELLIMQKSRSGWRIVKRRPLEVRSGK